MILKKLKAKNIRSIKDFQLEFPESTMLFHGDIGSGKSSVLKAIEFSLFGTLRKGDLMGDSLLRRGEQSASTELTFLISEKEYTVHRELKISTKKGETRVSQPSGWLIEDGVKTSYTTRELRRKILSIINYSVSRYEQKESIDIFRYTVYTPQEEIKYILQTDTKKRFEILKDVLEIEKYENTLSSLNIIKTEIRNILRDKERDLKKIGNPEEKIPEKKEEIVIKKTTIEKKKKDINSKRKELEKEKLKLDEIRKELGDCSSKIKEVEAKEEQITKDNDSIKKKLNQLTKIKDELEPVTKDLENLPMIKLKTDRSEKKLKQSLKELRIKGTKIVKDRTKIEGERRNIESLLKEGICLVCGQKIHEKERFDEELKEAERALQRLIEEIIKLNKEIKIIEEHIDNVRIYSDNEKEKKRLNGLIIERKKREEDIKTVLSELGKNIEENKQNIMVILNSYKIDDLKKFKELEHSLSKKLAEQEFNVDTIQNQIIELEKSLSSLETVLETLKNDLEELNEDLRQKRLLEKNIRYLSDVRDWVIDKFPVLLKDIERMVLTTTASHFNRYFKEWFKEMVEEENIDIQVNPENFDPIIMVNGYESPVRDLSGGEKSALSLAYRLALNKVINTKHQEIKTKDLLILDEPTDGFSQQQINKMQDIFEKLDTKQTIIISHERTLDSFVTDIFNFKKINHETTVDREN